MSSGYICPPIAVRGEINAARRSDGNRTVPGRFTGPSESPLTHRPGSVRALSGDRTMPPEIGRRPDDFYENVYLKIVR